MVDGFTQLLRDIDRPELIGEGLTLDVAGAIRDGYPNVRRNGDATPRSRVTPADRFRAMLVPADRLDSIPQPERLIDDVFSLDSLAVVYGPSGCGKTLVMGAMGLCIAAGMPWFGHVTVGGSVLYIAAEGVSGFPGRVNAWCDFHDVDQAPGRFFLLPAAVNLRSVQEAQAIGLLGADLDAVFIVFDTLNRCIGGGDENSSRDMGEAIRGLDIVREATGACVTVVHHSGKDTTAGARGHSSLRGAMDTEIEATNGLVLKAAKQKNMADGHVIERLVVTPHLDSVVVERAETSVDAIDAAALQLLRDLLDADPGTGLTSREWECATECATRTVQRKRGALAQHGMCANVGTAHRPRWVVTPQGKAALA